MSGEPEKQNPDAEGKRQKGFFDYFTSREVVGNWVPIILVPIIAILAIWFLSVQAYLRHDDNLSVVVYASQDEVFAEPIFKDFEKADQHQGAAGL
jgi:hypothetical protein